VPEASMLTKRLPKPLEGGGTANLNLFCATIYNKGLSLLDYGGCFPCSFQKSEFKTQRERLKFHVCYNDVEQSLVFLTEEYILRIFVGKKFWEDCLNIKGSKTPQSREKWLMSSFITLSFDALTKL
jgi:hypothetical protein